MRSDLRILVVGYVNKDYSDVFSTLNALVGRQAFDRGRVLEEQTESVEVEGGRRLWLTYMPDTLFRAMGDAYSEGRTTQLDKYGCVVIATEFNESNLRVKHNTVVTETLIQKFRKSFLQKRCVVIEGGGDRFDKVQRERRVKETFLQLCRSHSVNDDQFKAVFDAVQERWLLFNSNGSQNQLNQQRQQLVSMIDTEILVGSHFTDRKFKEVEKKADELEKKI